MAASEDIRKVTITIRNELGLHARPAMAFVDLASGYRADILVRKGEQSVDGKSIMQMMMLAAARGTELQVEASGPDADDAVEAIHDLAERRFDEE